MLRRVYVVHMGADRYNNRWREGIRDVAAQNTWTAILTNEAVYPK